MTNNKKHFIIVVFDDAQKMGFTVMKKNAKTIDDEKQFKTVAAAQAYADEHHPNAEIVIIREQDVAAKYIYSSAPHTQRKNGIWQPFKAFA